MPRHQRLSSLKKNQWDKMRRSPGFYRTHRNWQASFSLRSRFTGTARSPLLILPGRRRNFSCWWRGARRGGGGGGGRKNLLLGACLGCANASWHAAERPGRGRHGLLLPGKFLNRDIAAFR